MRWPPTSYPVVWKMMMRWPRFLDRYRARACRQDMVYEARGVGGGRGRILVTVEDDQRQRLRQQPGRASRALFHRRERRGQVTGSGVGQPGVHADGGVEIGVDRGHRAPGGKPGHVPGRYLRGSCL
jgi:hypothetical protein